MHTRDTKSALVEAGERERLRLTLAEWRRHHKAPTPIPADLWSRAVDLAGRLGVGPTARALNLDYGALKKQVANRVGQVRATSAPAEFIELLPRTMTMPGNTTVTNVRSNGPGWPSTDDINNLNQIVRQDITVGNVTTTSRFSFDASGNRATKTTSDTTQTYTWDEDNRLLQCELSINTACVFNTGEFNVDVYGPTGNSTVPYTWDILGGVDHEDR